MISYPLTLEDQSHIYEAGRNIWEAPQGTNEFNIIPLEFLCDL
jgi:hypothetical protein